MTSPPANRLAAGIEFAMGVIGAAGIAAGLYLFVAVMLTGHHAGAADTGHPAVQVQVPRAAEQYRSQLTRSARFYWGLDAPVAAFGAQIQQESAWHPQAKSAYAAGLAEFTPDTATWISGAYKLGAADPYNPDWALRALVAYDHDLWGKVPAVDACNRMAFVLSAYNGGLGWVYRDQGIAQSMGFPRSRWWGSVELFSHRSAQAMKENRGYPRRILLQLQPAYAGWGLGADCTGVAL